MAKRKVKKIQPQVKSGVFSQINWNESYVSLFLGAAVIIVAAVLAFSFIRTRNVSNNYATDSSFTTMEQEKEANGGQKTYTVKSGDDLWAISEKFYGSGYNWVDIAKANNLSNPGLIFSGNKLVIPNVEPKMAAVAVESQPVARESDTIQIENSAIRGSTYAVKVGDYLWEIAVRAYGDGYKWVDIAKANNLANPDFIFSGNVLIIPR